MFFLLTTLSALALDCDFSSFHDTLPVDGATEVPLNGRVSVVAADVDNSVELWSSDGVTQVDIALQQVDLGGGKYLNELTPSEALVANTAYEVRLFEDAILFATRTFTTGTTEDHESPTNTSFVDVRQQVETDEWGDWAEFAIDLEPSIDASPFWYEVELASDASFVGSWTRFSVRPEGARFFDGPCSVDPAALLSAEATHVRVRAVDVAGNASAVVDHAPAPDPVPSVEPSPGCSVLPARVAGLGLLLPVIGLRRRRE
jgi:hypothetical protein